MRFNSRGNRSRCRTIVFRLIGNAVRLALKLEVGVVCQAVLKFLNLAGIPVLYRAVISGDSGINLGVLSTLRALEVLTRNVPVVRANGIGRGDREVGQLIVRRNGTDKFRRRFPVLQSLTYKRMKDRPGSIFHLHSVFHIERIKDVSSGIHR